MPVEQEWDATIIYEMYENGEDISTYVPQGKYPEIYIYKDSDWIMREEVSSFLDALMRLNNHIDNAKNYPIIERLEILAELLAEVYYKAYLLPLCVYDEIGEDYGGINRYAFTDEEIVKHYLNNHIDLLLLNMLINEILDETMNYNYFVVNVYTEKYDIAQMISKIKFNFTGPDSWGQKVLDALSIIHENISELRYWENRK